MKGNMKLNKSTKGTGPAPARLAGGLGAVADRTSKLNELYRSVLACMLWENTAYASGKTIAQHIAELVPEVAPDKVAELAVEARSTAKLRAVPLLLVREMARYKTHAPYVANTLYEVIQRPDELTEFLSIYFKT
jgi:60 kDa SS-A/Ro ribonucleoprotein